MAKLNHWFISRVLLKTDGLLSAFNPNLNDVNNVKWKLIYTSTAVHAMKSDLPIKWIRPERIPSFHPKKSGDFESLEQIDMKQLAPEYKDLEEVKSADEPVKKLFTLEFQPYKSTVNYIRQQYVSKVQRHEFDNNSPEVRVARMTADIRDMQRYVEKFPYDKRTKVRVKETIDKRKRLLKRLRTWDYKCFEYVIEKLNLFYKPFPAHDVYKRVERKRSLRMLTDKYCDNIRSEKLKTYKEELESQKENFLEEKLNTFKWIMKEEAYCGVSPTITESDLKAVEQELHTLRESKKKDTSVVND